jgi:2-keto-4-pentenoate hydratase/2-oxohepta-3-ene-1,7-dioic acid hydratase in catechol pathway
MRVLKFAFVALAAVLVAMVGYSYAVSRPLFDEAWRSSQPSIAPRADALTFARTYDRLLLVLAHDAGAVRAIDLTAIYGLAQTADVVDFLARVGYDALERLDAPSLTVPVDALVEPLDADPPFIAAGTNYAEHAAEVSVDDPPFLFPKLAQPTPWNAAVRRAMRLDYEAELCLVPLSDIVHPDQDVEFGLLLCNDFTDRWTLVREIDLGEPMGLTGFAAAKGQPTFLPTGYLLVIPRRPDFYEGIRLELFVNDRLRQRFRAGDMILKPQDIVAQSFANADAPYRRGEARVELIAGGRIPKGTLILTGTAAGVIFRPVNVWNAGVYLAPGDLVRTRADFLGEMSNRIERDESG